jgi:hypothetical protein
VRGVKAYTAVERALCNTLCSMIAGDRLC